MIPFVFFLLWSRTDILHVCDQPGTMIKEISFERGPGNEWGPQIEGCH